MTLNQTLNKIYKEQVKATLIIGEEGAEYNDVIIRHIGREDVTFVETVRSKGKNLLIEYVIAKRLITGIGCTIASIELEKDDDINDDYWIDIIE